MTDTWGGYRSRLVETLRQQGVRDLAVLRAVGETPRHLFVPDAFQNRAYDDSALPIGHGQTISQPSTQAAYLEALALRGTERVLEIGTGSGYQAALLSLLVDTVISIERIGPLADRAREALRRAGVKNVSVVVGDGTLGWRPQAPYDAILVGAAGPDIPAPLVDQLADGGRLVLPLDTGAGQQLVRVRRDRGGATTEVIGPANFVPLLGRHGFSEGDD